MAEANRLQVTFRSVIAMSNKARAAKGLPTRAQERIGKAAEIAQFEPIQDNGCLVATPEGQAERYHVYSMAEFSGRDPPNWFVKGFMPDADMGVIYGAPGSGKSFFVTDLGLSIARGIPWRDHRVKQSRVIYLAAEGSSGLAMRLKAYAEHHDLPDLDFPFYIIADQPNLLETEDVEGVIAQITKHGGADLVIIDTLAQVTPGGNENSGQDIGKALRNARAIKEQTGAMVLFIHHSGKDDDKGARGWSGLKGAADVEIKISRKDDLRCAIVTKMKDGPDTGAYYFNLEQVALGVDGDGDALISLVVEPADPPDNDGTGDGDKKPNGKMQWAVFNAAHTLHDLCGGAVKPDDVIANVIYSDPTNPKTDPQHPQHKNYKTNLMRALKAVVDKGALFSDDEGVSPPAVAKNDEGGVA